MYHILIHIAIGRKLHFMDAMYLQGDKAGRIYDRMTANQSAASRVYVERLFVLEKGTMTEETDVQERFKAGDVLPNGIIFDPGVHRILKNGVVYDMVRKRIVCAPSPEHAPITKSNAKAVASGRWERAREAFARGVSEGMTGREDVPEKAWQRVGKKAAELLETANSARGFADLARFAGEAAGFVPLARGREEMQEQRPGEQPNVYIVLAQFIQQLPPAAPDPDVIDGEIKD